MSQVKTICINLDYLPEFAKNNLKKSGVSCFKYLEDPTDENEVIQAIGDAKEVVTSLQVKISRRVLKASSKTLKYIGIYGSSFGFVDIEAAKQFNITVKNVPEYCDQETAEFIPLVLLSLVRGLAPLQWRATPHSLNGKTIGLIGIGKVGSHVAKICLSLGMNVLYSARSKHDDVEALGVVYCEKKALIARSDFVSLHSPAHTSIFLEDDFDCFQDGTVLINTCLGEVFSPKDLQAFINRGKNLVIFDSIAGRSYPGINSYPRVWVTEYSAYDTQETKECINKIVCGNLKSYLADHSSVD